LSDRNSNLNQGQRAITNGDEFRDYVARKLKDFDIIRDRNDISEDERLMKIKDSGKKDSLWETSKIEKEHTIKSGIMGPPRDDMKENRKNKRIDILWEKWPNHFIAISCKYQDSQGSVEEKITDEKYSMLDYKNNNDYIKEIYIIINDGPLVKTRDKYIYNETFRVHKDIAPIYTVDDFFEMLLKEAVNSLK